MARLLGEDATKYRFAALGKIIYTNSAKRCFVASALISRVFQHMVPVDLGKTMNLNDILEQVNSKDTFIRYAQALADDFQDEQEKEAVNPTPWLGVVQGPNGWYNFTIDGFLEQMCAWARATSAMTDKPMVPEQPSWKAFAEMLSMGKEYE